MVDELAVGSNKNVDLAIYSKRKQLLELFYLIFLRGLFANLPVLCVKPLLFLAKIAMKKITQRICKDILVVRFFQPMLTIRLWMDYRDITAV